MPGQCSHSPRIEWWVCRVQCQLPHLRPVARRPLMRWWLLWCARPCLRLQGHSLNGPGNLPALHQVVIGPTLHGWGIVWWHEVTTVMQRENSTVHGCVMLWRGQSQALIYWIYWTPIVSSGSNAIESNCKWTPYILARITEHIRYRQCDNMEVQHLFNRCDELLTSPALAACGSRSPSEHPLRSLSLACSVPAGDQNHKSLPQSSRTKL